MGYQRGDNRHGGGDQRWRDRDPGNRYEEQARYGREHGHGDDDRGFIDRAGDEVRSWFGDDEAERRREEDQRRYEREHRMSGNRDNRSGGGDRGERYGGGSRDQGYGGAGGYGESYGSSGNEPADTWGGSGFGGGDGNRGRRFDRVDAGSTGTQGAHPMSSPVGATGYGASASSSGSSAREAAIINRGDPGRDHHDRHYSDWRNRQIESLDRDYDEYRREHQSKFEQDFGDWRSKRQGQRQSMGKVQEHMEVVGSDGQHIGTVDKVAGDKIILTKNDENAGGQHHSIPCSWIDSVDDKVIVNKSAEEAQREWKNAENNQAMFERDGERGEGPHVLNRSFSGTY